MRRLTRNKPSLRRRWAPAAIGLCAGLLLLGAAVPAHGADAIAPLRVTPDRCVLTGPYDGRQLLVTGTTANGEVRDLTRDAQYTAVPAGIVEVSASGYVRPVGDGEAVLAIQYAGRVTPVHLTVHGLHTNPPLHFARDVVPLLTRFGCNTGGCHGKASGQNGFKLSLFGFDPAFDYNAIVKEARGRRVFPAQPDASLILRKPSGAMPHGGGKRFGRDSDAYQVLRRWIQQGMPEGDAHAPTIQKLSILPPECVLARKAAQQVAVLAHYTDGSVRDVTRQAQYQSNETAIATVDDNGLIRTLDQSGEAAVMARYQGQVAVCRITAPLATTLASYPPFPAVNYIDTLALAQWKKLGLVPSALCTDGEFIRRVYLDLCGKLPTADQVRAFLADTHADKRCRLIDQCLEDKDHAGYMALRWGSILRNAATKQGGSEPAAYAFHDWLRDSIARNVPYDQFVRGILTASGQWQDSPAINWLWQMRDDPLHQPTADTAQIFLGVRLQCAHCHHHPYERWSQDDYYGLAGFFARLGRKDFGEEPAFFIERQRTVDEVNPRTQQPLEPKLLDGPVLTLGPNDDPREKLVDWMARPDNPLFARALCNRMWSYLMGRGLVDPIDDMRETNPPSNPALLDALAKDFIAHKFDVRHLLRTICNSRVYQLSSEPNESNRADRQNFARYYSKRLVAEVLLDAVDQACGTQTDFNKVPPKTRAVDLPHEGFDSFFLDVFDRPSRSSGCECARGSDASLSQVLHLSNSSEIEEKMAAETGRIARLVQAKTPATKALEELFLSTLARLPTADEQHKIGAFLQNKELRPTLEDVLWTILNSPEFLFNH
jgi:hypothetical protein